MVVPIRLITISFKISSLHKKKEKRGVPYLKFNHIYQLPFLAIANNRITIKLSPFLKTAEMVKQQFEGKVWGWGK